MLKQLTAREVLVLFIQKKNKYKIVYFHFNLHFYDKMRTMNVIETDISSDKNPIVLIMNR